MTAFVVFFFPILIYLGSWQVMRGLEKKDIVSQHYENKSLPVISEKEMATLNSENLIYRTVNLEGEYQSESYILDNRLYRQEAGYEIFTAFETSEKNLFLINRGWVSKEDYENGTEEAEGKVTIQGVLSPFKRFGLNLVINESVIQLSAGSAGAFEPIWKPVDLKPSRHFGYALQWFGLALVLICSYFYYGYKKD